MIDVMQVADNADMIINGYAFTRADKYVRVLNLNNPEKAVIIDKSGDVLELLNVCMSMQVIKN